MTDLALNMNFSEHAFSMASYFNSLSKSKVQQSQEIIESEKFLKSLSLWVQNKIENVPLENIQTHDILTTLLTINIDQDLEKNYRSGEKIRQMEESEIAEASIQDEINGHIISKGSVVVACTDAIHLHKDYWEKPNEFIPERFLSKEDYPLSYSQKLYTFGNGLRGCIGKQLALIKIKTFLVLLLRIYDIELVNENESAICKSYALKVCNSLLVKLKPRKV
ncbi:8378_t:CDS:2 [Gigaspora rosea]|nr:8378_t:CDS:2 [Gigaspora rosea]